MKIFCMSIAVSLSQFLSIFIESFFKEGSWPVLLLIKSMTISLNKAVFLLLEIENVR